MGYYGWDGYAYLRWRMRKDKGEARVNFAEPVEILDLAGTGSKKQQAQNLATRTRQIAIDLMNETRRMSIK